MNKKEFIRYISDKYNITNKAANKIVEQFTSSVISVLQEKQDIVLTGFGSFSVSDVEARAGRNPKTGEVIQIASYKQPKFKAGKKLKDAVN